MVSITVHEVTPPTGERGGEREGKGKRERREGQQVRSWCDKSHRIASRQHKQHFPFCIALQFCIVMQINQCGAMTPAGRSDVSAQDQGGKWMGRLDRCDLSCQGSRPRMQHRGRDCGLPTGEERRRKEPWAQARCRFKGSRGK